MPLMRLNLVWYRRHQCAVCCDQNTKLSCRQSLLRRPCPVHLISLMLRTSGVKPSLPAVPVPPCTPKERVYIPGTNPSGRPPLRGDIWPSNRGSFDDLEWPSRTFTIIQLPCTSHPSHSTPADDGPSTDTGVRSDPVPDRLLSQICLLLLCLLFKPFQVWFLVQLCSSWQDFNWHRS